MSLVRSLAVSLALLLAGCGSGDPGAGPEPAAAARDGDAAAASVGGASLAALGEGFAVWESNRTGRWRIWIRPFGGEARQLTPDRPGLNDCCAHASPDGTRVAYLSSAGGARSYPRGGLRGELRLLTVASGESTVLAPAARSYFENRAVVWRGPEELIFIDGDGAAQRLDLAAGRGERLTPPSGEENPWLVNATLSHASTGLPSFSPYDARRKAVAPSQEFGGCQPYFSRDGRWGFWTGATGGPLYRIELAERRVGTILDKNDERVPDGYGYAYFPMLSFDGTLFTWAASTGEHDHFRADYEVFVAEIDPRTLELAGPVHRVSFDGSSDRFPDVWRTPLELGRYAGEAPLTVSLEPPSGGGWKWEFGDGALSRGGRGVHVYEAPGRYPIAARRDGAEPLRGFAVVQPAAGPRVLEAMPVDNGAAVLVRFDESVAPGGGELRFASGRAVRAVRAAADGRAVRAELSEPLRSAERLTVSGFRDRASRPNTMEPVTLDVPPPSWPSRSEGLVFLWESADSPNLVFDPDLGAKRADPLECHGRARYDANFALVAAGGHCLLGGQPALRVVERLKRTNKLSLELTVEPGGGDGVVLASMTSRRGWNFRLLSRGGRLVFSLPVGTARRGVVEEAELLELPPGRATHVVLTYAPGLLTVYRNGEPVGRSDAVRGDAFHWTGHPLVLGGATPDDPWGGTLEGVAIYDRVLPAAEVKENFLSFVKTPSAPGAA